MSGQPVQRRRGTLRIVLLSLLAIVVLLCCGAVGLVTWVWNNTTTDTFGKVDFTNQLSIPPLAESRIDVQGRRVFDLTAQSGRHDFSAGKNAPTWGFNGSYLGPTLRAKQGEQVLVNVRNELSEQTSVHWHGMHLPAAMDGGPHQPVNPGTTWSPSWQIKQPAATLWYHPHPHGETARHVYNGLAGMFILDDDRAAGLNLPSRYGVDDLPVIVQDKNFEDSGKLDDRNSFLGGVGILGDTIAVNGTLAPYQEVTTDSVRLRLLNGSTARVFNFGFDDDRRFAMIASDGGLLTAPHQTRRIQLSPGERAEIVVRVKPGEQTILRSYPAELGLDGFSGRFTGGDDKFDVLQLRGAAELTATPDLPERLASIDRVDATASAQNRTFRLSGHNINGSQMRMDRLDFAAAKDQTEVWEVTNRDGAPHSFHVHDVQFQIASISGGKPPAHLAGWKDTIYLPPNETFRLVLRFTDYADPNTPYMYHCHVLYHEDAGMMGQFVVTNPGQQPGTLPNTHATH